jgi:hypothetical protein
MIVRWVPRELPRFLLLQLRVSMRVASQHDTLFGDLLQDPRQSPSRKPRWTRMPRSDRPPRPGAYLCRQSHRHCRCQGSAKRLPKDVRENSFQTPLRRMIQAEENKLIGD